MKLAVIATFLLFAAPVLAQSVGEKSGVNSACAAALEHVVSEETQDRYHDPRHLAVAAAPAGPTARAILHKDST